MAIEEKKYLGTTAVERLIFKTREEINAGDEATLAAAKAHAEGLADNYDPAGTAVTKVQELADGAVKQNTDAIAKLNGDASTEGSVAKAVADAKALIDADVEAVDEKADANAGEITTLKGRMDGAEGDIDAIQEDVGNVDELETTNKELVKAINEVRNSVSAGGVSAAVTMDTTTTSDGALKSYTIKQGDNVVGTIDIPKDMVVESGEVVTNPEGQAEGTYIKLVLANVADPLYINVGTLVDIYKAKASAAQVQIAIDSATREISATIVAGSIGSTELADNAVVTAKIADKNVTKAKLSAEVQASLDKADAAAPQTALDAEVERATAAEAKALSDAKAHAEGIVATEKARAEGIEAGLEERLADVESQLGSGEGSVEEKIATAKQEAIDAAAQDASDKDAQVLADAKADSAAKAAVNKGLIDGLDGRVGENETDIANLEASLAEGGATANAIADAKQAGTDAQAAVDALEEGEVANLRTDVDALKSVSYVEFTANEIDAMFAA